MNYRTSVIPVADPGSDATPSSGAALIGSAANLPKSVIILMQLR